MKYDVITKATVAYQYVVEADSAEQAEALVEKALAADGATELECSVYDPGVEEVLKGQTSPLE
jgi:hypothetical protein